MTGQGLLGPSLDILFRGTVVYLGDAARSGREARLDRD
jgi:hypothetical protein